MVITSMKSFKTCTVYLLCYWLSAPALFSADSGPLRGYSTEAARAERDWEAKFRGLPDPANLRAYMQRLSARPPHLAGNRITTNPV
jgi:N-acetylated-alpha-linked acidic dipeptidase